LLLAELYRIVHFTLLRNEERIEYYSHEILAKKKYREIRVEMFTEKGLILIVKAANEFLGKEKLIKDMCFFDAECDDTTDE